jgi:hypothetical protein
VPQPGESGHWSWIFPHANLLPRYGRLPAQVSTFFDACGQLWAAGAVSGSYFIRKGISDGRHSWSAKPVPSSPRLPDSTEDTR